MEYERVFCCLSCESFCGYSVPVLTYSRTLEVDTKSSTEEMMILTSIAPWLQFLLLFLGLEIRAFSRIQQDVGPVVLRVDRQSTMYARLRTKRIERADFAEKEPLPGLPVLDGLK